jgi:hypothetical protein
MFDPKVQARHRLPNHLFSFLLDSVPDGSLLQRCSNFRKDGIFREFFGEEETDRMF